MLRLGHAYVGVNDEQAAARLFNTCLDQAQEEEAELRVNALIGLGSIAVRRSDHATAEVLYLRALDSYVPALGVDISETEGRLELSVVETPTGLAITNPASWYFLDRFVVDTGPDVGSSDAPATVVLFGVGKPAEGRSDAAPASDAGTAEGAANIEVFPLQVNVTLADIWMSLARLYFRWDRMMEAHAACRLAAEMHVQLEDDEGTLNAIELLRIIIANFSLSRAGDLQTDLQLLLDRVQQTGNRQLAGRILQVIADSNFDQGRLEEAERAYSETRRVGVELEDRSLEAAAEIALARVMRKKEDYKAAAERLETVLRHISPGQHVLVGNVESEFAELDVAGYDYASAARHFEAAAAAYERAGEDLLRAGMERRIASLEIDNRKYAAAIHRLEGVTAAAKATEIPSSIAETLADLAGAYSSGGNRTSAISTAEEALQITDKIDVPPTRAAILLTLAEILRTQRQFDAAKNATSQARDIYHRLADVRGEIAALRTLSTIYSENRESEMQLETAREAGRLADALDREDRRQARMTLALALSDAHSGRQAVELMEEVVRERPEDAIAIGNLGWVLYSAGEYERSIAESRRALERDPAQAFVLRNIGHAYLALRKPDEAEKAYRQAVNERRGGEDFDESIRCVRELLEKYPDLPRGQEMLAMLGRAQADLEEQWKTAAQRVGR